MAQKYLKTFKMVWVKCSIIKLIYNYENFSNLTSVCDLGFGSFASNIFGSNRRSGLLSYSCESAILWSWEISFRLVVFSLLLSRSGAQFFFLVRKRLARQDCKQGEKGEKKEKPLEPGYQSVSVEYAVTLLPSYCFYSITPSTKFVCFP